MIHFQAGCLLWSGRPPGPAAFSLWALGRDEPDLFRVYSFLAQAEHRLPQPHNRYLFEDPLLAPFSSQGDPREVVAHFRKAALYLQKREFAAGDFSVFFEWVRRLYGFIAAKVEFSMRLGALMEKGDGGGEMRRQVLQLMQENHELKELYREVRCRSFQSDGFPEIGERFDALQRSFQRLIQ